MSGVRIQIKKKDVGLKIIPCTALFTSYTGHRKIFQLPNMITACTQGLPKVSFFL